MASRGHCTDPCLEPQTASARRCHKGPSVEEKKGRGVGSGEEGRADVLPCGGPGAWASATADTSVSVRGSDPPPTPPTTSTEGG
jgi:hypothetical protein